MAQPAFASRRKGSNQAANPVFEKIFSFYRQQLNLQLPQKAVNEIESRAGERPTNESVRNAINQYLRGRGHTRSSSETQRPSAASQGHDQSSYEVQRPSAGSPGHRPSSSGTQHRPSSSETQRPTAKAQGHRESQSHQESSFTTQKPLAERKKPREK